MATELEELLHFLSSPSPQVRKAAIDIVQGLTGSEDGLQSLAKHPKVLLPSLARLLREQKDVAERAAEALVNLSQNSDLAAKMIDLGLVAAALDLLYNVDSSISQLLLMLLVNLTQLDAGIASLLQESGRKLLLDPKRGLLKQIIRQCDSTSQLRKKGVFGTLRNCCFEAEGQLQNLLLISEFLWPALLLPVAGSKVYKEEDTSKMPLELGSALSIEREQTGDPEIRVQVLEAIYMITLQEAGRRAFWSINGPKILQVGYEDEEDPKVMEAFERVGSLLIHSGGDEESHD
ncbi:protein HGH1 homolog isoform X3 [Momordica charantia]|uniref:Protein HGH1 homolog n=1 Tax=Momordica charantia TaxID=3673 RepID=A0A6J1DTM8_MOMCH|nr:protein HGH1 homolog isoform X3 [Momordica charantia]